MITIGVIACGQPKETGQCLNAIEEHSTEYQLIFVNNNASKKAFDTKGIVISFNSLVSVSKARNAILNKAKGEFIAFIDNDIIVCSGWQEAMLVPFDDPLVGIVGYEAMQITTDFEKQYLAKKDERFDYVDSPYVLRKSMIDQIGGYDENLGMATGDNTDLMIRARKNGWKIALIDNPGIQHKHGMTRASFDQDWIWSEIEKSKQHLRDVWGPNWKTEDFWSPR